MRGGNEKGDFDLNLLIPKIRSGGYVPFFIVERKKSEQALIAIIQETFVKGVSTRKVERLARALSILK